ncbi:DUF2750 domain-containing protein [Amycolatopsis sp. NPDC005003]
MNEFPPLTAEEAGLWSAKPGASRALYLVRSVVASGLICAWGDDEDTAMMEDSEGRVVVPVWPHPEFAIREFGPVTPDEKPVPADLDRFLEVWLPGLEEDGYGLAVFPVDDRIAVTWTPAEFASKIRAERAKAASGAQ